MKQVLHRTGLAKVRLVAALELLNDEVQDMLLEALQFWQAHLLWEARETPYKGRRFDSPPFLAQLFVFGNTLIRKD